MSWKRLGLVYGLCVLALACGDDTGPKAASDLKPGPDAGDAGDAPAKCTGDHQCSDGVFCNGIERCMPNAEAADEHGCVRARRERCLASQECDESAAACLSECDGSADADEDGHDAENCGGLDCDDADAERFPGNAEVCDADGHDEDCEPETLAGDDGDRDHDGHVSDRCCNAGRCGKDCDDDEEHGFYTHPGAGELCDEVDNDCDDAVDESPTEVPWYPDEDGDHYGVSGEDGTISCAPVEGHGLFDTDCDDSDRSVNPGTAEACDGADNDCDEAIDEGLRCGGCVPACGRNAECVETPSGPSCLCDEGFMGEDPACVDIDECEADTDDCDPAPDACRNTSGGFSCECPNGYVGSGRGEGSCKDFNECANDEHDCDREPPACVNTTGSYACECPEGTEGDGVGESGCEDVDECETGAHDCDDDPGACVNEVAGFSCECPEGYEGDGIGADGCEDVDECASAATHDCGASPAACENTIGGYECGCADGYTQEGEGCIDVDECATDNGGCDENPDACNNVMGSYYCQCPIDYAGSGMGEEGCLPAPGCDIDSGYPGDENCLAAPDPLAGIQIHIGPSDYTDLEEVERFLIQPGEEVVNCYHFHLPNAEARYFQRFELGARPGTFRSAFNLPAVEVTDGGFQACVGGTDAMVLTSISEEIPEHPVAPENAGVASVLEANAPGEIELHSFNFEDESQLRELWLNLYFAEPSQVIELAKPLHVYGGLGFAITPGSDMVYSYSCPIGAEGRILWLQTAMHAHSVRQTAWIHREGDERVRIFEHYDWQKQVPYYFDSVTPAMTPNPATMQGGGAGGILAVAPGDVLEWECHVVNTDMDTLRYTNQVLSGEMCNLFGQSVGVDVGCNRD